MQMDADEPSGSKFAWVLDEVCATSSASGYITNAI
jgi:hypothetical protein